MTTTGPNLSLACLGVPARRRPGSNHRIACTGRHKSSCRRGQGRRRIPSSSRPTTAATEEMVARRGTARQQPRLLSSSSVFLRRRCRALLRTSSTASGQQSLNCVHRSSQKQLPLGLKPPQNPSQLEGGDGGDGGSGGDGGGDGGDGGIGGIGGIGGDGGTERHSSTASGQQSSRSVQTASQKHPNGVPEPQNVWQLAGGDGGGAGGVKSPHCERKNNRERYGEMEGWRERKEN